MTNIYEDVCKAFKTGWWDANAATRKILIDKNLSSLLNLSSTEYSFDELLECVILTDKELFCSILNTHTSYPLTNWEITLRIREATYHLEIIFELPKEDEKSTDSLTGYARVQIINDHKILTMNPIKVGTPYCTVHNNIQTELQDHNVRLFGVCKIGIIHPWTWCIKRGRVEIMSVAKNTLTNDEVALDHFIDSIHPSDRDAFRQQVDTITNGLTYSLNAIFRSTFFSKDYRWYEIMANITECHSLDKRFRCVGILHDIDDKRKNEEALNNSDNLIRTIYDNTPVGIELYDKQGRLVNNNKKVLDIFGVSASDDLSRLNLFEDPSIPVDFKKGLKEGRSTEASIDYDLDSIPQTYYKTSLKGIIHLLTRGTPLYNNQNEILNYLIVHFDQTENITQNNRITDFENFFSAIAEYAQVGYCKWDIIAKRGFAIDQWFINLGEDSHGDIESVILNYQHLHPEDRAMMVKRIDNIRKGESKSYKHEIRVKNGDSWKWIYHNVIVTKYEPWNGSIEAVGINIDISSYKEMEFKLIETVQKAEALVVERDIVIDNLSSGLIYVNANFIVQWESTKILHPIFTDAGYIPGEVCYRTAFGRETPCESCPIITGKRTSAYREKDGYTLEINSNPIYDKYGILTGCVVQLIDITTRKQQERKIKELSDLMTAILNNIPVNIYVKNPSDNFNYMYWNESMSIISGLKASDVIGRNDFDIMTKEAAQEIRDANQEQIKNNVEKDITEDTFKDAYEEEHILNAIRVLIKTEEELPLIMGASWDITELKRYEEELILAKESAEESNRIKSAFLANMSHEIRTPLNAIVGFSELITDHHIGKEDKDEYIGIIRRNCQLLLQLISDILDLSRIEAHVLEFNYDTININVLCNRIAMTTNLHDEAKVPILFDSNSPEYLVFTDENRLQQIIVNFVNNAVKFTHEGEIRIGYSLLNDTEIEIYVQDTGVGIPKSKLASIFERFVKLDSFVQGTGLGLSICQSLVEIMKGRIGVESEEGKGTRFWFTLPYDPNLSIQE